MPMSISVSDPRIPRVHARRLPQPNKRELARRSAVIAEVTAKRFAGVAFRQVRHARSGPLPLAVLAKPLRRTFEDLGGTYMKFGQLVASSPGVFGEEFADEFRTCLDTGPVVPFETVRDVIETDLGMPLHEAFSHFDTVPIGRASIAVVHRATTVGGENVAVKVLRPGIEANVAVDLDLLQPLLELVALPLMVVPEPFPECSGPNVLTMEFLDGVPIDDLAGAAKFGVDPAPLVEQVVRAFFLTTVRWGAFHGDVHAGNMLLLRDGRMGVIDWGIVGRLDPETHYFFIRLLAAALGDEEAYGPAMQRGLGLSDEDLATFIRSLIEPVLNRPFGEVSLAALIQAPQVQAAKAQGIEAHNRSMKAVVGRLRAQRQLRRLADESGGTDSDFDRGTFLLGKQLMYFERYGKMFLADVPLLHDRAFFETLLASAPEPTRAPAIPPTPRRT